jgi:hypothetical protein
MNGSGRRSITGLLPLLLMLAACTEPVVVIEEPAAVETCERLIPVGIELVNDYVYTLEETDVGAAGGDASQLPTSIMALNARGEELDRRAAELECGLDELNQAIIGATEGITSSDPVVQVLLETIRRGVVGGRKGAGSAVGEWQFVEGSVFDEPILLAPEQTITLVVDDNGIGSGSTGCNEYTIGPAAAAGVWPVQGFVVTDGPCPSASHAAGQDAYLDAFLLVTEYVVGDESLELSGPSVNLYFSRTPAAS